MVKERERLPPNFQEPEEEDTDDPVTVTGFIHPDGLVPEPELDPMFMSDQEFERYIREKMEGLGL
jgi:hypothetical protein